MFVAGAGAKLYNEASQVAITRVGDRTTISMRNDYKGDTKDFALVVPVPVVPIQLLVMVIPSAPASTWIPCWVKLVIIRPFTSLPSLFAVKVRPLTPAPAELPSIRMMGSPA